MVVTDLVGDCQVQTSFSFISLLITLRALSLLISVATWLVSSQLPHVGYSGEGVPCGLTAHSLKGLYLNLRGFTAYRPFCLERVNTPRVWWVFLPLLYLYYIIGVEVCQPLFLIFKGFFARSPLVLSFFLNPTPPKPDPYSHSVEQLSLQEVSALLPSL